MRLMSRGANFNPNLQDFVIIDPTTHTTPDFFRPLSLVYDHYKATSHSNSSWFRGKTYPRLKLLLESDNLEDFRYENLLTNFPEIFI